MGDTSEGRAGHAFGQGSGPLAAGPRPVTHDPPAAAASGCDDRPLAVLVFLLMWPFWLFRDASRGDRGARTAAYRHNRAMRVHLPGYLVRWSLSAMLVFGFMAGVDSLARSLEFASLPLTVVAAALGVVLSACVAVLVMTAYVYWYLTVNE